MKIRLDRQAKTCLWSISAHGKVLARDYRIVC